MITTEKGFAITGAFTVIVLALTVLFLAPLAYIWGWNQLFGTLHYIDYTFWNWLAVVFLTAMFQSKLTRTVKK